MTRVLFTSGVRSALTATPILHATGIRRSRIGSGIHCGVWCDLQTIRVDQATVAAGQHEEHEERQPSHCFTQTKEMRPFSDSGMEPAIIGPAASQDFRLEKPGTEVNARTSAGTRKNQTTSVHMGDS